MSNIRNGNVLLVPVSFFGNSYVNFLNNLMLNIGLCHVHDKVSNVEKLHI